jgi:hypothetical protein
MVLTFLHAMRHRIQALCLVYLLRVCLSIRYLLLDYNPSIF